MLALVHKEFLCPPCPPRARHHPRDNVSYSKFRMTTRHPRRKMKERTLFDTAARCNAFVGITNVSAISTLKRDRGCIFQTAIFSGRISAVFS